MPVKTAARVITDSARALAPIDRAADRRSLMAAEVRNGFSLPQKELPPTYFYDERGSLLFEQITQLPEYYLSRRERDLLAHHADPLIRRIRPASVGELGPGSGSKSRMLIEAARRVRPRIVYVPLDISALTLARTTAELEHEYAGLTVLPLVADMRRSTRLPATLPRPLLYAFLGSTIGNFTSEEAADLLSGMSAGMGSSDRLLLGVDLVKDVSVLEAAYNDAAGVTAEFNLNVLIVLNRELGADFDLGGFAHNAFYNTDLRRIEMHLVALRAQRVQIPAVGNFSFVRGESIRTEISCKYERTGVERLLSLAGVTLEEWITDEQAWFALAVGAPHR